MAALTAKVKGKVFTLMNIGLELIPVSTGSQPPPDVGKNQTVNLTVHWYRHISVYIGCPLSK